MANKYRGVKWNNAGAGPKVKIRRSIWLAELQDFGAITDSPDDLPTRGATHRGSLGATSGTREYVNLSTVNDLAVVDTQDHGLITDTAISAAVWKTNPENDNDTGSYSQPSSLGPFAYYYGTYGSGNNQRTSQGSSSIPRVHYDSQGTAWNYNGTSFYQMHDSNTISEWTKADYKIHVPGQFSVIDYTTGNFPPSEQVGLSTFNYTTIGTSNATNQLSLNTDADAFVWNDDGTKLYTWRDLGGASDAFVYVDTYTLTTAWDVSTASFSTATQIEANSGSNRNPISMNMHDNGSKLAITYKDLGTDGVRLYDLGTSWDASTASYNTNYRVTSNPIRTWYSNSTSSNFDGNVQGVLWAADGKQLFVVDINAIWNTYHLETPYDLMSGLRRGNNPGQNLSANTGFGEVIIGEISEDGGVLISNQPTTATPPDVSFNYYLFNQMKKDYSVSTYGTHSVDFTGFGGLQIHMTNQTTFINSQSSWGIDYWHKSDSANAGLQRMVDRTNQLRFWKDSSGLITTSIYAYDSGSSGSVGWKTLQSYENNADWHHISVQYHGGTAYLYIDGVMKDSQAMGTVPDPGTSQYGDYEIPLDLGLSSSTSTNNDFLMIDFRVKATTAIYTGGSTSFTVPSSAPTVDANTTILLEANATHVQDKTDNFCVFLGQNIGGTDNGNITFSTNKPY